MDTIEHTPQVHVAEQPVRLESRRRDRPGGWGASCSWPRRRSSWLAGSVSRAVLQDTSGDAVAVLLSDDAAAILPTDLQPNDSARQTYVVWGTSAPEPVALATFDVTAGGSDVRLLSWSPDARRHDGFGISLEEGRTVPARPSAVLASGQVGPA
jgi:hypothetical protein